MKRGIISIILVLCMLLSSLYALSACSNDSTQRTPLATPFSLPSARLDLTPLPKLTPPPSPTPATTQQEIHYATQPISGYSLSMTVYVSNSGKIHTNSHCSGMKYYNTMTYGHACQYGYSHCQNCF